MALFEVDDCEPSTWISGAQIQPHEAVSHIIALKNWFRANKHETLFIHILFRFMFFFSFFFLVLLCPTRSDAAPSSRWCAIDSGKPIHLYLIVDIYLSPEQHWVFEKFSKWFLCITFGYRWDIWSHIVCWCVSNWPPNWLICMFTHP